MNINSDGIKVSTSGKKVTIDGPVLSVVYLGDTMVGDPDKKESPARGNSINIGDFSIKGGHVRIDTIIDQLTVNGKNIELHI